MPPQTPPIFNQNKGKMAYFDELLQKAITVRNNRAPASNTADLVGGVLVSIVSALQMLLDDKQDELTFDSAPTADSQNPVTSDGIYQALQAIDLSACEKIVNKVTSINAQSTDVQYPTAKLLYDSLQALSGIYAAIQHTHAIADLTDAYALFTQFALNNGNVYITVGGQQRNITLPTAATPSGDPMHYVYIDLGCVYDTNSGLWTYKDLTDLTTAQVRDAYTFTACERNMATKTALYRTPKSRFNFAPDSAFQDNQTISLDRFGQDNTTFEYVYLNAGSNVAVINSNNVFLLAGCSNLIKVHNVLKVTSFYVAPTGVNKNAFNGCPKLETLKLQGLGTGLFLDWNAALSLESISYMIVNAANSVSARTIYLHADAYARAQADTTEYSYGGNTYIGCLALASARNITIATT